MSDDGKKSLRCSFCGKHEQQVNRLIQGPGVRICDECVHLCMSILEDGFDDEDVDILDDMPDQLPTPGRSRRFWISMSSDRRRQRFPCPWLSTITINEFSLAAMRMWSCRRATS